MYRVPPTGLAQPAAPAVSRPGVTKSLAMSLFGNGQTIAEVSRQTGRAVSTISEYLAEFILAERPDSIEIWVPESEYQRVAAAIKRHGSQRMKPIFSALNQAVPYNQIRAVAVHLQCGKARNKS